MSTLIDCPLCGLPMETKSRWPQPQARPVGEHGPREVIDMVAAACFAGHWFAGPARDLLG